MGSDETTENNMTIKIKGVRVNNLKNISLEIPRGKFIAIAGVSGSGKSSLAFDTIYAEGQRRYVESLSSYARQFLGRMSKPECDFIQGLPPAIAIEQKVISRNPRSTVGTSTEIYEYMRLLFARIGRIYSPVSGTEVKKHSAEDVVECMTNHEDGARFLLVAPIIVSKGHSLRHKFEMMVHQGYSRLYVNESVEYIDDILQKTDERLDSLFKAEGRAILDTPVYLLIDRMTASHEQETISRLTDSAETAFYEGHGECCLVFPREGETFVFSTRLEADGLMFEEPSDQLFAFNSPIGVCPECGGFGKVIGIDPHLVIPDSSKSVNDGCVQCWHGDKMSEWQKWFIRLNSERGFPIFTPYCELSQEDRDWLWHGTIPKRVPANLRTMRPEEKEWGLICIDEFFRMLRENQYKIQYRVMLARYRGKSVCPTCNGTRLRKEANYVKIGGRSITDLVSLPVDELLLWIKELELSKHDAEVAKRLLREITSRLQYLVDVGLGYLTLNRQSNTLSGGESQRINLTTSLGSSLVGSLYILDEPSIGLHSRDTKRLIGVLRKLQQLGNTVIVVEHDEDILRAADHLIDVGPDAGSLGGEIVFQGDAKDINAEALECYPLSHTVKYLTGAEHIPVPSSRRPWNMAIELNGCRMNNLKGVDVRFPLNCMTVVTGVSGSGKSSLVKGILYPCIKRHLNEVCDAPGEYSSLGGDWQHIKHVEMVDQNPIGKSTRSNPATYMKAYDAIRSLMAEQPLAKQMGITAQHFSFNTDGGRCEECKGAGVTIVEMQFMADLVLTCDSCHGERFKREILEVRYEGKNVNDILAMTVTDAIRFFEAQLKRVSEGNKSKSKEAVYLATIIDRLRPLEEVGLGYIQLAQSSSTLSGGENQRVKLAYYISQEHQDSTLFIFDEPTTGLHFHDIKRLLHAFDELIKHGHTVLIVEHNMDVIKCADHIIDLGPEGGATGGYIVATGTPEEIAKCSKSYTGEFLGKVL